MVLVQFLITYDSNGGAGGGGNYYNCGLYGLHDIIVLGVQFHDTGANTQFRCLELQSDLLRFPHSARQYFTIFNNAQANLNFSSAVDSATYSILNADLNGRIFFNVAVVGGTNSQALNANWNLVLTLEVTQVKSSK